MCAFVSRLQPADLFVVGLVVLFVTGWILDSLRVAWLQVKQLFESFDHDGDTL